MHSVDSPHPSLVDPGFWRRQLGGLDGSPQRLLVFPRSDLSEPGLEVVELCLKPGCGESLRGLYARSAFFTNSQGVHLRVTEKLDPADLCLERVRAGEAELLLQVPASHALRDRVLDILRMSRASQTDRGLRIHHFEVDDPAVGPVPDAVLIARHLLASDLG